MAKKVHKLTVCLYGASHCGFGYLATGPAKVLKTGKLVNNFEKMLGSKETEPGLMALEFGSATEALYAAHAALKEAWKGKRPSAEVTVFLPGGELCATVELGSCKAVGDLKWTAAPVYTVSVEELLRAEEGGPK